MHEAAEGREKLDLRALEFLLQDYNATVAAGDWDRADDVRKRMNPALVRGPAVASQAAARKEARRRAELERRMAFEARQRKLDREQAERHHREKMSEIHQLRNQIERGNHYGW